MAARDCPNCGANVRDDGTSDSVRCRFCGTQVVIPRARRVASRRQLEAERDELLAREGELEIRLKESNARGLEDFLIPPVGCCGIYFALFVVGTLILSAIGLKDSKPYGTAVAAIAILAALAGVLFIVVRREKRRSERAFALRQERTVDGSLRAERLREIDAELAALKDEGS